MIEQETINRTIKEKVSDSAKAVIRGGQRFVSSFKASDFHLGQIKRLYTQTSGFANKLFSYVPENYFVTTIKDIAVSEVISEGLLYTVDNHGPQKYQEELRNAIQTGRVLSNGIRVGNALGRVPGFRNPALIPFRYLIGGLAAYHLMKQVDYRRLTTESVS